MLRRREPRPARLLIRFAGNVLGISRECSGNAKATLLKNFLSNVFALSACVMKINRPLLVTFLILAASLTSAASYDWPGLKITKWQP